jgi:nucleoside-diphosphate-sugar epimerase
MFGNENPITKLTPLRPETLYGQSKAKGEELLQQLKKIIVQIVRLPNVYGKNCPGTFYHRVEMLSRFKWLPIYITDYKFSLISVENVAKSLIRLLLVRWKWCVLSSRFANIKYYGQNKRNGKSKWDKSKTI